MYKFLLLAVLLLSGCSYFTITASMCEKIANEPGSILPQECEAYDEKKADDAFNKITDEKKTPNVDLEVSKDAK